MNQAAERQSQERAGHNTDGAQVWVWARWLLIAVALFDCVFAHVNGRDAWQFLWFIPMGLLACGTTGVLLRRYGPPPLSTACEAFRIGLLVIWIPYVVPAVVCAVQDAFALTNWLGLRSPVFRSISALYILLACFADSAILFWVVCRVAPARTENEPLKTLPSIPATRAMPGAGKLRTLHRSSWMLAPQGHHRLRVEHPWTVAVTRNGLIRRHFVTCSPKLPHVETPLEGGANQHILPVMERQPPSHTSLTFFSRMPE